MAAITDVQLDSLLFGEQGVAPATPASGAGRLYAKSGGLYFMGDDGIEVGPLGASGGGAATMEPGSLFSGIDDRAQFNAEFGSTDEGYDEEFDGAGIATGTLPTGWSWVNQDTATYYQRFSHGRIDWGGGGDGSDIHAVVRSLPAGLQSCDIWAHLYGAQAARVGYESALVLRNSANGKMLLMGRYTPVYASSTAGDYPVWYANLYTDADTFDAVQQGPRNVFPAASPHWYAHIVVASPTDWRLYVNPDGGCDFGIGSPASLDITAALGAVPDQIGFGLTTAQGSHVGCEWIRVRDIVTSP